MSHIHQTNPPKSSVKTAAKQAIEIDRTKEMMNDERMRYFEKLMRHDSHRRVGGRIRQQRWGE